MKVLVSHPTGNRNVRAILASFQANGSLAEFDTTLSVSAYSKMLRLLPRGLRSELLRRSFDIQRDLIHSFPWRELARMAFPKLGLARLTRHETGWASIDGVYQVFDQSVAKRLPPLAASRKIDAVYAYEDGALATFKTAKKLGIGCIYDLPIAYWETKRKLLEQEMIRLPQWKKTLGGGIADSAAKLARKTEELDLADAIVSPSSFVSTSLPDWIDREKVILSPFGSPNDQGWEIKDSAICADTKRPLRILFVGSMTQRKGLGDLFCAMKMVKNRNVELVVMGSMLESIEFYREQYKDFMYEPGRPNAEVLQLMRTCDVFCLPSIVEGRALVLQEAMSQGLPLIITPNTGGDDLIIEGETGFLVAPGDAKAIAEKIDWFANNRSKIPDMAIRAKEHAGNYTWEQYGARILSGIAKFIN